MQKIPLYLCGLFFLLIAPSVQAHTLKVDGSIGGVMHIDPDDDPLAGQTSNIYISFKDRDAKFQPANCNCKLTVSEQGKQLASVPLTFATNSMDASVATIFPQYDVYQLHVMGSPLQSQAFQSFDLEYDVRVDRGLAGSSTSSSNKKMIIVITTVGIVGLIACVGLGLMYTRKPKKS